MARHDISDRAPNRMIFQEQLDKAVAENNRNGAFAVLCLDLDNFKTVNDTLGHQSGDQLLQVAAKRLEGALAKAIWWRGSAEMSLRSCSWSKNNLLPQPLWPAGWSKS